MPFDLVGFSEATPGAGTVYIVPAANEQLYSVSGDDLKVKSTAQYLLGVLYDALTVPVRCLLRQPQRIDIDISKAKLGTDLDPNMGWTHLYSRPLKLNVDKLNALSVNAADEITTIALLLGSGKITRSAQEGVKVDHIIRGTSAQTITAHTWTSATVTWAESLEAGKYAVVGMRGTSYKAATPQTALARLAIPGALNWKPGVPLGNALAATPQSRHEPWSQWPLMPEIAFDTTVGYPNVELLSSTANTAHVIELALQKVG